jgi:hypothetical protein
MTATGLIPSSAMNASLFTTQELNEARGWISDCEWRDLDDVDELTDAEVAAGVARHYEGGWCQFRSDALL